MSDEKTNPALRGFRGFRLILASKNRILQHKLVSLKKEPLLKVGVILFATTLFWVGIFFFFRSGFKLVDRYEIYGEFLIETLMSLFIFSLTVMLIFSNAIIGYASMFRSHESGFLMTQPIKLEQIFLSKFLETLSFSSWALFLVAAPVFLALGLKMNAPLYFYPCSLLALLVYIPIPASIGMILSLALARWFPSKSGKFFALVVLGGLAAVLLIKLNALSGNVLDLGITQVWMAGILNRVSFCHNPILPSFWITRIVMDSAEGWNQDVTFFALITLSHALFLPMLPYHLAKKIYFGAWSRSQGAQHQTYAPRKQEYLFWRISRRLLGRMHHLFQKDFRSFYRDPVQLSQILIFFGLLAIYFLNIQNLTFGTGDRFWKNFIGFLNLTTTALVLTTFTTRFVFPQVSLEGRCFWIIGLLPIKRRNIILSKFLFALSGSLLITFTLIAISSHMLKIPNIILLLHLITITLICFGLAGLSTGLGAAFPNFQENNPSKIVSGFGGTLNLILSFIFVISCVVLGAIPTHLYLVKGWISEKTFVQYLILAFSGMVILTAAAMLIPLYAGIRRFEKMEF